MRKDSAWSEAKVWEWLDLIERMAEVHMPGQLDLHVVRDPADDKFIVAAVEGQADYIVSGDKDLLDLGRYEEIEIVSPRQFLQVLSTER